MTTEVLKRKLDEVGVRGLPRAAKGEPGWAAARFFPRKTLRRLNPHNDSPPTEEVTKPGLAGCFIYLKKFLRL